MSRHNGWALAIIASAMVANLLYVLMRFGDRGGMFFPASDQFADFIKFALSFPGGHPRLPDPLGFAALIDAYLHDNPYVDGIGNKHVPPITVLIASVSRAAMTVVPPVTLYLATISIFLTSLFVLIGHYDRRLATCACVSYPLWFLVDRGNIFAGICAICLIAALLRAKTDWLAALLVSLALSIRPNAIVAIVPLLALDLRFAGRVAAVSIPLNLVALAAAGQLYPGYSLRTFVEGLARYRASFVNGDDGIAFGSSLDGALRFLLHKQAAGAAAVLALIQVPLAIAQYRRGRLTYAGLTFCCLAAYALATTALGDYHLLVFIAPLVLLDRDDDAFWPIFLASVLILSPKNYQPAGEISWQVALNPAILLVAMLVILLRASRTPPAPLSCAVPAGDS